MIKVKDLSKFFKIVVCLYLFSSASFGEEKDSIVLEKAIGHLIVYETESRINGQIGVHSPLTEVFKTYYEYIEQLPKERRAMFLFMVDNQLNVHGGSDLYDFFDFVFLCCSDEYANLVEDNLSNRYFDNEIFERKLNIVKNLEKRIKKRADRNSRTMSEQKEYMKSEFLEMIRITRENEEELDAH